MPRMRREKARLIHGCCGGCGCSTGKNSTGLGPNQKSELEGSTSEERDIQPVEKSIEKEGSTGKDREVDMSICFQVAALHKPLVNPCFLQSLKVM